MRLQIARATLFLSLFGISVVSSAHAQTSQPPTRAFPPLPSEAQPQEEQRASVAAPARPEAMAEMPAASSSAPPAWQPPAWQPPADQANDEHASDRWEDRPRLLEAHAGFGTPYGEIGIAFELDLVRYFGFVIGSGLGESGPQFVAGARGRLPLGSVVALGLELSWSGGSYHAGCHEFCFGTENETYVTWTFAHWINFAPAIEFRAARGFNARIYGGYGNILNEKECPESSDFYSYCQDDDELPFLGTSFGVAF